MFTIQKFTISNTHNFTVVIFRNETETVQSHNFQALGNLKDKPSDQEQIKKVVNELHNKAAKIDLVIN